MGGARRWSWSDPVGPLLEALDRGGVLAIPSESSYGLAVDPRNPQAVAAVYRIKGRPPAHPLPVVAGEVDQFAALGVRLEEAVGLGLAALWPAPLTLVLPCAGDLPAAAGGRHLAVRIPGHERLRGLLQRVGRALTATSANRSGEPPILDPAELADLLEGEDAIVVDDGLLPGGEPSTILAVRARGVELLRRGGYPLERLPAGTLTETGAEAFSAASVEIPVDESS